MNLYHLRYFVTLARLEHYTKAATQLCITQPSLSYAISTLEDELGVKLFEKSGRNVSLTRSGKAFLKDVDEILNRLDASTNNLRLASKGEGTIDLAFVRTLGIDFVPKLIRRFLDANPRQNIHFNVNYDKSVSFDILTGLKEKKFDIAFCSKVENEPSIEFFPIAKQNLVVIMPEGHPLTACEQLNLEDTLPYKQIIFSETSGLRQIVDGLFHSIEKYPDVAFEVAEDQVAAGFVANGFGICVLPEIKLLTCMNIESRPLVSPNWSREFYMATLKDRYFPTIVENFRNFVIELTGQEWGGEALGAYDIY